MASGELTGRLAAVTDVPARARVVAAVRRVPNSGEA